LAPDLKREEWFFGTVPSDEIVSCFYYEHARSRDDICQLVRSWREKLANLDKAYDDANTDEMVMARCGRWDETFSSLETATNRFWSELAQLTDRTCSQLLINLAEFPDVPWQEIRPAKRAKWKHLLTFTRDRYPDGILGGLLPETNQNTLLDAILYNQMRTSRGELVPFSIDWGGGVEKVISDFKKWARKHYSELGLPRKKKPRDTYYESLRQLGVVRLKERLGSWNVVQRYTRKVLGYELYGDDHMLWRRARLAAIKRKRDMFPVMFPTSLTH